MQVLGLPLLVQVCLAFGMAGLFWPEKLKPLFEVLLFPWFPSYRTVRAHSVGAILLSAVLFLTWIVRSGLIVP
jgi:hypothetical protein